MVPGCWRKEQLNHLGNPFFVSIVLFSGCIAHVGWACGASLYKDLPGFLPSSLHEDSRFNIVRDGFTCFNEWVVICLREHLQETLVFISKTIAFL